MDVASHHPAPHAPALDEHGQDTIFALASGSGRAAIAVVRLSGPRSGPLLDRLCGRRPPARRAVLKALRDLFMAYCLRRKLDVIPLVSQFYTKANIFRHELGKSTNLVIR